MFQSFRASNLAIRIGLALVYAGLGIETFLNPANAVVLMGLFYVLVAISLVTGFFLRVFALLALAVFVVVSIINGIDIFRIQDIGIIGGLLAIAFWPERRY